MHTYSLRDLANVARPPRRNRTQIRTGPTQLHTLRKTQLFLRAIFILSFQEGNWRRTEGGLLPRASGRADPGQFSATA